MSAIKPAPPAVFTFTVGLLLGTVTLSTCQATDLSLGLAAAGFIVPYKDTPVKVMPLPAVGYEDGTLFWQGARGGFHVVENSSHRLDFYLGVDPRQFRPQDSTDWQIRQLNKRRIGVASGLAYTLTTRAGDFSTSLERDVINHSDGMSAEAAWSYTLRQDRWSLIPAAGVRWDNGAQNRYYYGISEEESRRSHLAEWHPGEAFTPWLGLSLRYAPGDQLLTYISAQYERLPDEVRHSPMSDRDSAAIITAGFSYRFL